MKKQIREIFHQILNGNSTVIAYENLLKLIWDKLQLKFTAYATRSNEISYFLNQFINHEKDYEKRNDMIALRNHFVEYDPLIRRKMSAIQRFHQSQHTFSEESVKDLSDWTKRFSGTEFTDILERYFDKAKEIADR